MSAPASVASTVPPFASAEPKRTGFYAMIGGAVLVVLLAFMFLGGEKPGGMLVSVAGPGGTAVEGVQVLVDGEVRCEQSTCKIEDLDPGSYVVKAVAEGYAELAGTAYEVKAGEEKPINIELVSAATTGIKVTSEAPGLSLTIDGNKVGPLPQEVGSLTPGEHTIEVAGSQFFKNFEKTVTLKKGEMLEFEPDLQLEKGKVSIKLDESARGAEVWLIVNGKRRSLTPHVEKGSPIILPVEDKDYELLARKRGYEDFKQDLAFSADDPVQTVTISMSEKDREGRSSSTTSRTSSASRTSPSPSPAPAASPAPATGNGKLNINSIPVSNVLVDGRPLGSTPKIGVSVSAGSHTVVFIHPQHGRKTRTVKVKAGGTATAAVRFP